MRVNLGVQQNPFINAHRVNQSIAAKNGGASSAQGSRNLPVDSVSISPQGKENSMLDNLMKQKLRITEQKDKLISSTLENGGTMDSIKTQLETYEEQLEGIDEQIAEMTAKEMEKQAESAKPKESNKPKTEEEVQNGRLADITSLSTDLVQADVMSSVQTRADGNARVLKSEIELDKMRAGSSEGAIEMIAKKEAVLSGLERKSMKLTSQIANKIADTVDKVSENSKPQETVTEADEKQDEQTTLNSIQNKQDIVSGKEESNEIK